MQEDFIYGEYDGHHTFFETDDRGQKFTFLLNYNGFIQFVNYFFSWVHLGGHCTNNAENFMHRIVLGANC